VLCLGSGVSRSSNIPDWRELLLRLAARAWPERPPEFREELLNSGFSLPAIASILEGQLGEDFVQAVRETLYCDFPFYNKPTMAGYRKRIVSDVQTRNLTLRAVAALCTRKVAGHYERSRNVRAIVNLNFDVLLRTYMRERYGGYLLRTVERPDASISRHKIPTYHAHGLIHFDPSRFNDLDEESPDLMVFTEQQYFDFFGRAFAVFSYTMMSLLREHSFVFVGTALRDDNLRRLLHYNFQERQDAAKRRGRVKQPGRLLRHFLIGRRCGNRQVDDATQLAHERIGVRTLWLGGWEELPAFLGGLYKEEASTWERVYGTAK
jgi:SIR2-like domain